jgi:hypothetical protein
VKAYTKHKCTLWAGCIVLTLSGRLCFENRRSQVVKGILNPRKATERAVLLEKLVQEGHKVKKQNVLLTSTIEEAVSSAL